VLSGKAFPEPVLGQASMKPANFLIEAAKGHGLQHLTPGLFGSVREGWIRTSLTGHQTSNSFAVLVTALKEGGDLPLTFTRLRKTFWSTPYTLEVKPPSEYQLAINYRGPRSAVGTFDGTFPCIRATLASLRAVDSKYLENKIVIVGSAIRVEDNTYPTPYSGITYQPEEMWTAEIQANLVDTLLTGDYIRFPTTAGKICWLMLVGLLAGLLSINRRVLPVILFLLIYSIVLVYVTDWFFFLNDFSLPLLSTLMVPWLTSLFVAVGTRVAMGDREIQMLREVFGRSVSPAIANELVAKMTGHSSKEKGGQLLAEECVGSILFLDVANFTSLSENHPPESLFHFTNQLLDRLSKGVFENEGSLIRYTGDGLIALFGRPIERLDHAGLACEAALRMREELEILNLERRKQGEPSVQIRIGVNTGRIMVGLLGGQQRYDYTALGNEVNIAARFERLNKDFGTSILVGEPTVEQLKDEFICRPLGSISLKGKTEQVPFYELVCRTGEVISDHLKEFLKLYEIGYIALRNNRFQEAIAAFNNALIHKPEDLATQKLLARAEERTRSGSTTMN
jgi:adenylate cyclase